MDRVSPVSGEGGQGFVNVLGRNVLGRRIATSWGESEERATTFRLESTKKRLHSN